MGRGVFCLSLRNPVRTTFSYCHVSWTLVWDFSNKLCRRYSSRSTHAQLLEILHALCVPARAPRSRSSTETVSQGIIGKPDNAHRVYYETINVRYTLVQSTLHLGWQSHRMKKWPISECKIHDFNQICGIMVALWKQYFEFEKFTAL